MRLLGSETAGERGGGGTLEVSEETPVWSPHDARSEGLCLEATVQPAVNLALTHNGVPLVRSVRLTNESGRALEDVALTLTLTGQGAVLAEQLTARLPAPVPSGEYRCWDALGAFAPLYSHLATLDESHRALVRATVSHAWGPDLVLSVPIQVLARSEWFNAPLFYESLAAFVQPNTSSVAEILGVASELLQVHTGDASLGGYQRGPERASRIVAAVYEALRSRAIRYVSPPASFEESGQKVRTTRQVLDERLGTCIDLAVTYAACLEETGLRPLIWLIDGHAFAGYLREEGMLGQTVVTEANVMINLVESGRAVPVEAVYYEPTDNGTFAAAVAAGHRHLGSPQALRGVIDVYAAHRAGTRPLPSDDVPRPVDSSPASSSPLATPDLDLPSELLVGAEEHDVLLETEDDAPQRVRQWKRSLLDLSLRNRLLNLRASSEVLDLHVPVGTLALLDDIVHEGKAVSLIAQDDLSDLHRLQGARRAQDLDAELVRRTLVDDRAVFAAVTQQSYVTRMRRLQRTARTMLEETGSANLYLTIGALVHPTPTGSEARAPLFLLPARIEGGAGRSAFQVRVDTTSVASPNHCLIEWLRIKHDVRIEALQTPKLDHSGIDIKAALPAIRDALVEYRLDARIDEVATIAICQFSTFGMWRDLDQSWDVLSRSSVVEHLAFRAGDSFVDPAAPDDEQDLQAIPIDEAETPLPIPADGSQLRAVTLGAAGRSFVLEGPPGTGKSQTITNLIAHALANDRTVLFVAEKQAALDVVKRRLADVGLSDFTLNLHGRSQRPAEIREQLKRAIDNVSVYDRHGWEAACASLRARHAPLHEYPARVHQPNAVGVSLWSAAENLQQYGPGPVAPIPAMFVTTPGIDETPLKDALRTFARAARTAALRPQHPWSLVGRPPADLDAQSLTEAAATLEAARAAAQAQTSAWCLLEAVDRPSVLAELLPHLDDRAAGSAPDAAQLARLRAPTWRAARERLTAETADFVSQHASVLQTFTSSFLEHGDLAALLAAADTAAKGLLGKRKRAQAFEQAVRPLLADGANIQPAQVPGLVIAIQAARTHAEQLGADRAQLLGVANAPMWTPLRAEAEDRLVSQLALLERCDAFEREHKALFERLQSTALSPEVIEVLRDVAAAWDLWQAVLGSGREEIRRWAGERHWTAAWSADEETWRREVADSADGSVRRWAHMAALLEPLAQAGLVELQDQLLSAALAAADAEMAYLRGVAVTSLQERRAAAGFQSFDPEIRNGEISDFADAAAAVRAELRVALPAGLLERRPYRADRLSGSVGELRRRLDAKRGGLSFRQLMERYGEEILQATPCFFVSPASLAQFVPPGSVTFDLVVFDEASQVTVPQSIGALGRARSAVVVGDSEQMPPTSVGKAKLTDAAAEPADPEAELEAVEDLQSILEECVESGLPRVWLSWHYRSREETLIAFSNAQYYEGRLATLPSPGGDPSAGVELRRLDGHFNREDTKNEFRTNRVEAEAIVAEIRRMLADPCTADESIGVVTFNSQQRDLVLNLLEECEDPMVARQLREDAHEGIFVKNLENVQGDERDVVLFSVAFSKPSDGGRLPMNFGPLGATGGEKRLNVAVTRARRKVIVFASFDPHDIDLTRTGSKGIAHLRSYLELAQDGPGSLTATSGSRAVIGDDHVRAEIGGALRDHGYLVEADFGLSDFSLDLVVREPDAERWQVAIVLDGPRWADRSTVADRDLTPLLLEHAMGWGALLRVWLPEWLDDREAVLRRVKDAIRRAQDSEERAQERRVHAAAERRRALEEVSAAPALASVEEDIEETVEVETLTFAGGPEQRLAGDAREVPALATMTAGLEPASMPMRRSRSVTGDGRGVPYVAVEPTPLGSREDLGRTTSPRVRKTIADAVRDTVEVEGPIEASRLARSIGHRFGFDRVASARQRFILQVVPRERIRSSALGEFMWPANLDPDAWRGYRATPENMERPLTEVAPEEIVNAMVHSASGRRCSDEEQLFRATLEIFGQRRLTGPTSARLAACLELGVRNSRLLRAPDGSWYSGD